MLRAATVEDLPDRPQTGQRARLRPDMSRTDESLPSVTGILGGSPSIRRRSQRNCRQLAAQAGTVVAAWEKPEHRLPRDDRMSRPITAANLDPDQSRAGSELGTVSPPSLRLP